MKKSILATTSLVALLLAGCGNTEDQAVQDETEQEESVDQEDTSQEESTDQEESADSEEASEEEGTVELTDSADHDVTVPKNPERLAVFDNGQLDLLRDLGLADRVVVTASSTMPSYLDTFSDVPVAGTLHEVDLEEANAQDPDLAIVAGRSRESFDGLNEFVPTMDVSNNVGDVWESIQENLDYYAQIFDLETEAEDLKDELAADLEELQGMTEDSDLETLFVMTNEGSLSAYGPGTRFGFVHDLFGFEPVDPDIEASRHGMDISFEYVLEQDPDVIFVLDRTAVVGGEESGDLSENPLIQETSAYENDQIIYLDPEVWYLGEGGSTAFQTTIEEVSAVFE